MIKLRLTFLLFMAWTTNSFAVFFPIEKLFKNKPPMYKFLEEIYKLTYREHTFDCSNKAALFVKILNDAGIESKIMIVKDDIKYNNKPHAVVLIPNYNNQSVVCDPTNDEWYFNEDVEKVGKFMCFISHNSINNDDNEYGYAKTVYNKMRASLNKIMKK